LTISEKVKKNGYGNDFKRVKMLFIKICLVVRFFHQCERSVRFKFGWMIFVESVEMKNREMLEKK